MKPPEKEILLADKAPLAIGPYSVGIRVGHLIFTAGQIGLIRETGEMAPGGIEGETRQVLKNIENILQAAGSSLDRVVKTTVFLADLEDFKKMNSVYAEFFTDAYPARSTVAVAALPRDARVEIEAVAIIPSSRGD